MRLDKRDHKSLVLWATEGAEHVLPYRGGIRGCPILTDLAPPISDHRAPKEIGLSPGSGDLSLAYLILPYVMVGVGVIACYSDRGGVIPSTSV
jgi:hypothetical protein